MMWECACEPLPAMAGQRLRPLRAGAPVTYRQMLRLWAEDAACRDFFTEALTAAPYDVFYWETPPVTLASLDRDFECVLLEASSLSRQPDALSFAAEFRAAGENAPVTIFANLSGDATLIAPCPRGAPSAYPSLAPFLRQAPAAQRHALWQAVGVAMQARLGTAPLWLSTAGDGVAWLHVRLDRRPKYYRFAPYRPVRPELS